MILRIKRLTTNSADITTSVTKFYNRLLVRGHLSATIKPIFTKCLQQTDTTIKPKIDPDSCLFLHLKYHKYDPSSHAIQKLYSEKELQKNGKLPLTQVFSQLSQTGRKIPLYRLILAYHRFRN
jgi:hypothetical protein